METWEGGIVSRFVLAALASWRLSFLLVKEDGPWGALARLRAQASTDPFRDLLQCVKCTSIWVSLPFAFFVVGDWVALVVTWLALSGVVALIDEWIRPPFDWQEEKGDGLLRTGSDRTDD